jgi:hypothetical protein
MTDATPTTELALRQDIATLEYRLETMQAVMQESMGQLELALEDVGWRRLIGNAEQEFSRSGLETLVAICRLMALKNPLIKQGVKVITNYVFGQGVTMHARNPDVNAVIQSFIDDTKNKAELTSHQAMLLKEKDLLSSGNVFLVLFTNRVTGRVRVRSIPLSEVQEIICNPDDSKDPWYYKRTWIEQRIDGSTQSHIAYYPDWQYRPTNRRFQINNATIMWDSPVYHIKDGGFSDMRFGIPEIYAAIDWARAYKEFLEDWATITRALSRFAWKASTKGGARGVAALKNRLNTTMGTGAGMGLAAETNPPPVTGSVAVLGENTDLTPIRTSGATTSMEDGRRLLLMVASALGLPETFFGDVSVGTLATATSMDRPTALSMANRQQTWQAVLSGILGYVVEQAAVAPQGALHHLATATSRIDDGEIVTTLEWASDPATGQPITPGIMLDFPPIVEQETTQRVASIMAAAPQLPDSKLVARLLLSALGVPEIDEVLTAMYPPLPTGQRGERTPALQGGQDATQSA